MINEMRHVAGLSPAEQAMLDETVDTYHEKIARNRRLLVYYKQKNRLNDLGIAIPPHLRSISTCIGWPAKAVDTVAVRSRLEGFVFHEEDDSGLDVVLADNNFDSLYGQLVTSELIHSCAFVTVTAGGQGEPAAVISAYDATQAAAVWDRRRKRVKCGITVIDADRQGEATWIDLFTDEAVITMRKGSAGWRAEHYPHKHGRPLIEPLAYRPMLDRPFGKSRITQTVMDLTDCAVRELMRTEVGAEHYTAPQRWLLGVAADLFGEQDPASAVSVSRNKWEAYIGAILAITRDENGELPQVGQFPQMTMQPHLDYLRMLASLFSGETGVPMSSLGIVHDNPASAEAIYAGKEDLIIEAQELNLTNGHALANVGLLALATIRNVPVGELDEDDYTIMANFRPVDKPSSVSMADAAIKQASAAPWLAETTVFLEHLGFSENEIARVNSERSNAAAIERIKARMFGNDDAA